RCIPLDPLGAQRSAPPERLQFNLPVNFRTTDVVYAVPPVQISMPTEKPLDTPVPFRRQRSKSYPNLDIFKEMEQETIKSINACIMMIDRLVKLEEKTITNMNQFLWKSLLEALRPSKLTIEPSKKEKLV
ncbi:hypothetical protein pdam_00014467, partial [Pocillopora damicornis]